MEEKVFRLMTTHVLINKVVLDHKDIFAAAMAIEDYPKEIIQRYKGPETDKYIEIMKSINENELINMTTSDMLIVPLALHAVSGKDKYMNMLNKALENAALSSNNIADILALSLTSVIMSAYAEYYDGMVEILGAPWNIEINDETINDPEVNPLSKVIILEKLEKTNTPEYKKYLDEAKRTLINFDEAYEHYKNTLEEFLADPKKFVVNTYLYDDAYEAFVKGFTIDEFTAFFTDRPPIILSNFGLMTRIYELSLDEFRYNYNKDYRIHTTVSAEELYLALSDPASLIFS